MHRFNARSLSILIIIIAALVISANQANAAAASRAPSQQYDAGDPTASEQFVLELINRARSNPPAEATRLNITNSSGAIDITEGLPDPTLVKVQPPLAMNKILLGTARGHSQDMYANNYFAHESQNGTVSPSQRIQAAGYNFNTFGENIATASNLDAGGLEDLLMVDSGVTGRGHRQNLLSAFSTTTPVYQEIGAGYFLGSGDESNIEQNVLTEDFGSTGTTGPFILGVVYNDQNGNNFYDAGEGISGVSVTPDSGTFFAVTSTSGGFVIPVTAGTYNLTFASSTLGSVVKSVTVGTDNVKIDARTSEFSNGGTGNNPPPPSPTPAPGSPVITSTLTATAAVGTPFSYQITASGAGVTFSSSNLPSFLTSNSLTSNGNIISGTPTVGGLVAINLSATNSLGTDNEVLMLTITKSTADSAPQFVSPPTASPAFPTTGSAVTLTASATDTDNDLLLYTWDFADGTTGLGATITHVYTTPGVYQVKVTVSDGISTISDTVDVAVNSATSTVQPGDLNVQKVQLKFDFVHSGKDSIKLSGTLNVGVGFSPHNASLSVFLGKSVTTSTLNAHATSSDRSFKLTGKLSKAGTFTAPQAKFTFSLRNQKLFDALSDFGFTKTGSGPVHMNAIVELSGVSYTAPITVNYSTKQSKTGPSTGTGK